MPSFDEDKRKKVVTGALDTQNHLKVALAVKDFLDTILDPQQPIGVIHPGAIPALQKILIKAKVAYGEVSDECLLAFTAIRATCDKHEQLSASVFRERIERYTTLLSFFNSSRITRESMDIDRAAELQIFVSALVEAAGGPKALSKSRAL